MYDNDDPASKSLDLSSWIEKARSGTAAYRDRQVTDILLTAVAMTPSLRQKLFLKGGLLMSLAYQSPRMTSDIDFTTPERPEDFIASIEAEINKALARAIAKLGYNTLVCKVQRIERRPRKDLFLDAQFPALQMTIGSAERGTREEEHFNIGQASRVLKVEVSFNEPVEDLDELHIGETKGHLKAYSAPQSLFACRADRREIKSLSSAGEKKTQPTTGYL
jgi:hypothetical protein